MINIRDINLFRNFEQPYYPCVSSMKQCRGCVRAPPRKIQYFVTSGPDSPHTTRHWGIGLLALYKGPLAAPCPGNNLWFLVFLGRRATQIHHRNEQRDTKMILRCKCNCYFSSLFYPPEGRILQVTNFTGWRRLRIIDVVEPFRQTALRGFKSTLLPQVWEQSKRTHG